MLEKTLESPLDIKEIKPVNLKGNQPWIIILEGLMLALLCSNTLAILCEELTDWKRPRYWDRLMAGAENDDRG